MHSVALSLALFLALLPQAAQPPATSAPVEKCTIEGQVVRAGTGEPLKKAVVSVYKVESQELPKVAVTDTEGRFLLEDIEPGRYGLSASRNGYVSQDYGERGRNRRGTIIALASGQHLKDILFQLVPAGVIAGRVYDEDGEPLPGVLVQAMQYHYRDGKKELAPGRETATDDRGQYRLFALSPGSYYVMSTYSSIIMFGILRLQRRGGPAPGDESYSPTYFPGTSDPAQATPIEVSAGEEVSAIDFLLLPTRAVRVRGRVVGALPRGGDTEVVLIRRGGRMRSIGADPRSQVERDGRFELYGVTPGSYLLVAVSYSEEDYQPRASQMPLEVGGVDVDGVQLALQPGVEISGRLHKEGAPPKPAATAAPSAPPQPPLEPSEPHDLSQLEVYLEPTEELPFGFAFGRVKEEGTFTLRSVSPGDYRVAVGGLPPDYYLKAARLGGDNVLEAGLTLTGGQAPQLELWVSGDGARVEGAVVDAEGQPVSGAQVVLVPEARRRDRRDLYRTAATDQYGQFRLRGIAPGEYELYAWEEVEPGAYRDPDFLRRYQEHSEAVRLREGEFKSLTLKVISTQSPES